VKRALFLAIFLAACGGEPAPAPEPEAPAPAPEQTEVQKVAAVAKAIQADPSRIDVVLADSGMTRADLEAALWRIASNADDSQAYREALGR
jgi:hypothetical protein